MTIARTVLLAVALLLAAAAPALGARPTDEGQPTDGFFYGVPEEPPLCGERTCVHYVTTTNHAPANLADDDADGRPDAVERVLAASEQAIRRLTTAEPEGIGWRSPLSDGTRGGGDGLIDLYVKDLGGRSSGNAVRDPGQAPNPRTFAFIQIDHRMLATGLSAFLADDLVPHELGHLVSYAYDGFFESWHGESTAEWLAATSSQTFAQVLPWLPLWAQSTTLPLAIRREPGQPPTGKAYAGWVWHHWLAERYGPQQVREVWERLGDQAPTAFGLSAVDRALAGDSSFFDEFIRFAAAHAEWRTATAGFGAASAGWPEVPRLGTVEPGGAAVPAKLDHTAFAVFDVPVRPGAAMELQVRAPQGTASAIALVGRTGDAVTGTPEVALRPLPAGGDATVSIPRPERFSRLTAVVVNGDATRASDRRDESGQWTYAKEAQPYELTARVTATVEAPASAEPPPAGVEVTEPSRSGPEAGPLAPPVVEDDLLAPSVRSLLVGRPALRLLRAGRALVARLTTDEPARLTATLRVGGRLVASSSSKALAGSRRVVLRPTRAGRRRLPRPSRGARTAALRLVLTDAAGNARVVRRTVRLR